MPLPFGSHHAQRGGKAEKLFKNQTPPRPLQGSGIRRRMDQVQRLRPAAQPVPLRDPRGKQLRHADAGERTLYCLGDDLIRQACSQRVDRHDTPRHTPRRIQRFKHGICHRVAEVVSGQAAVKAIGLPAQEAIGSICGVKKGQIQPSRMVGDGHLCQLQAAAVRLGDTVGLRIGRDGRKEAGGRIDLQRRDRNKPRPILVVAGVKAQQLAERRNAKLFKQRRLLRTDARQRQD